MNTEGMVEIVPGGAPSMFFFLSSFSSSFVVVVVLFFFCRAGYSTPCAFVFSSFRSEEVEREGRDVVDPSAVAGVAVVAVLVEEEETVVSSPVPIVSFFHFSSSSIGRSEDGSKEEEEPDILCSFSSGNFCSPTNTTLPRADRCGQAVVVGALQALLWE